MDGPIIQLRDVSKAYGGASVLHSIDLDVAQGELLAVVGTSGSGKSTLLNIIGGLDTRFTGQATVAGQSLGQLSDSTLSLFRNQKIGFVFQQFNLLDHLSCAENVAVPATFTRRGEEGARQRAVAALDRVVAQHRAHQVVIVTHDIIVKLLVADCLGVSSSIYRRLELVANGSLTVLRIGETTRRLSAFNDAAHLEDLAR